jgi:hypothetical protein
MRFKEAIFSALPRRPRGREEDGYESVGISFGSLHFSDTLFGVIFDAACNITRPNLAAYGSRDHPKPFQVWKITVAVWLTLRPPNQKRRYQ